MENYMSDDKIAALVDRAKYRDKDAIAALIHEVHPQVIARLSYCGIYQEDLKETSRQVYVRAFRSLDTLADPEDFRHWILQIAEAEAALKKQDCAENLPDPAAEEEPERETRPEDVPAEETAPEPIGDEKKTSPAVAIALIAFVAVALIAVLIGFRAFGPSKSIAMPVPRDEPAVTVEAMEKALNELDEKAIIACFDSASREKYSDEKEEVHEWITTIGSFLKMTGIAPKFELETGDVEYQGDDHCTAKVKLSYAWIGIEDTQEVTVPMVLEGSHWYILAEKFAEDFDKEDLPEGLF